MVDLGGSCIIKAVNSGTLTVEIRLSPDAPQEIIQELLALVVAPSTNAGATVVQPAESGKVRIQLRAGAISSGEVQARLVKLIPAEGKTGKLSIMATLAVLLCLSTILYNVTGTAENILQFLEHYRSYFQTKVNGSVVPIDQAKETIKNAEQPQPTPRNEHPEKSTDPSAISSDGD